MPIHIAVAPKAQPSSSPLAAGAPRSNPADPSRAERRDSASAKTLLGAPPNVPADPGSTRGRHGGGQGGSQGGAGTGGGPARRSGRRRLNEEGDAPGRSADEPLVVQTTDIHQLQAKFHAQQTVVSNLSQIPGRVGELSTKMGDWMLQLLSVLGTRF